MRWSTYRTSETLWPALHRRDAQRPLLVILLISTIAEYWRWCVVHLWVEGFFEVFATVIIAFLLVRLGLVHAAPAGGRRAETEVDVAISAV
jgi:nitric oxide reductase subunit B